MKALVFIKRAIDYNVRIKVRQDGSGVETDGVKFSINPFDEIALEEALQMREAGHVSEVVVVSAGTDACQQQLRTGLAMGADRAIHVETDQTLQPLTIAHAFHALVVKENADIALLGKQSIDGDHNQTGQMLAALWGRPQATNAAKVELKEGTARVTREVDAGLEVLDIDLPGVITADLRLNTPRFVKLPDIMKAKKKPLDVVVLGDLLEGNADDLLVGGWTPPEPRSKGIMVETASDLVDELKQRGLL